MFRLQSFTFRCYVPRWVAAVALTLSVSTAGAAYNANSIEELPDSAFPALYYWSQNYGRGFGPYSTTYRYGAHPGYNRVTNYFKDLDGGRGFLVEQAAALLTIFAESEAHALATCCDDGKELRAVQRTGTLNVALHGGFGYGDAAWDADVWYPVDNTVRHVDQFAEWNFTLYSGRACPDNHVLWGLYADSGLEDFFCAVAQGQPDRELNLGEPSCPGAGGIPPIGIGNPVHIATGNKFQREPVYSAGNAGAFEFDLFYNSQALKLRAWEKWSHSYARSLTGSLGMSLAHAEEVAGLSQSKYLSIVATRPDGRVLRFANVLDWQARTTREVAWSGSGNAVARLSSLNHPHTGELEGLMLQTSGGEQERYALDGRLISITRPDGEVLTMHYNPVGQLERVSDAFGRAATFRYAGALLKEMTAPDGAVYRFNHDVSGNLAEVIFPDLTVDDDADNPRRTFRYEDPRFPSHLTGITEERGYRTASWTYDDQGRAITSEHADGADRHALVFNADGTTTVIDPLGSQRTYAFETHNGLTRLASIDGGQCSRCGGDAARYVYDARGFVTRKTDFNGNTTTYVRDDRGREVSRTEAAGTAVARTVSTTWHPTFNKPLRVEEEARATTYTYDAQGRLLSSSVLPLR